MQENCNNNNNLHTIVQKIAQCPVNQRNYFSQFCAMNLHLGQEVGKIQKVRRWTNHELAEKMNMSLRTINYAKAQQDMDVSVLYRFSEVLNYNFFELLHPVTADSTMVLEDTQKEYKAGKELKVNLEITYPMYLSNELGKFIMHVHSIADKMGFRIG